jgi:hypothetical protein
MAEQKADVVTVYSFGILNLAVLGYCILWILLDISLSNSWPFYAPNQHGFDSATFGLLNVLITFLLKCVICIKLFSEFPVSRKTYTRVVVIGCWTHLVFGELVRGPLYMRFRQFSDTYITTRDKYDNWHDEDPWSFSASIFISLLRHLTDFILIPLAIRHAILKSMADSKGKKSDDSDTPADKVFIDMIKSK